LTQKKKKKKDQNSILVTDVPAFRSLFFLGQSLDHIQSV
jgi:hypothetical protein